MANKAGELAGKTESYHCDPLRISALQGYFNTEGRRDTQSVAEKSSSFVHYLFFVALIPKTLQHIYQKVMTGLRVISILSSDQKIREDNYEETFFRNSGCFGLVGGISGGAASC